MTRRRVEITFERERLLVVRQRVSITDWCEGCGARVRMVMVDEAARLTGTTDRALYRLIECGRLHSREESEAGLLVCVESLKEFSQHLGNSLSTEEKKGAEK